MGNMTTTMPPHHDNNITIIGTWSKIPHTYKTAPSPLSKLLPTPQVPVFSPAIVNHVGPTCFHHRFSFDVVKWRVRLLKLSCDILYISHPLYNLHIASPYIISVQNTMSYYTIQYYMYCNNHGSRDNTNESGYSYI